MSFIMFLGKFRPLFLSGGMSHKEIHGKVMCPAKITLGTIHILRTVSTILGLYFFSTKKEEKKMAIFYPLTNQVLT